jgi:hypothetical protein
MVCFSSQVRRFPLSHVQCRRSRIWMSHCKVHDEPWNHIARPYYPLSKEPTARWEEFSDEPWFPDRMTSALFWAIDRGKEPSNLATVLLCLAPRHAAIGAWGAFGRGSALELCSLCSPADTVEMRGCNSIAPLACMVESNIFRSLVRPSSTRTHSFWRYVRTRTSPSAPHFYFYLLSISTITFR